MSDSPTAILFDVNGNPVGTVIDGVFYRLQVEAKLAPGTSTIGKVDQGAPNSSINAWPVSIQNATMPNIQNLSIETNLAVDGYNINAGIYSASVTFTNDALLAALELRFSTTASRNISVSIDGVTILFSETANTSLLLELDFEDYAIDTGTIVTLTISQTGAACLADITLTSKVSTPVSGVNPILGSGTSHIGSISIDSNNSGSTDAFGRLRISNPQSLFEVTHQYDLAPRLMGLQRQDASTSITHNSPVATLSVPATAGRKIVYQSHQHIIYLPGKSHFIRMTGTLDGASAIAGMGYGDGYDGIFLENNSGTMRLIFLSSTIANQTVTQANWNIDKLDGYGTSGYTLATSVAYHLVIDLSWLGVGRIRVGLDIGGTLIYVHQFIFSNVVTTAYMRAGSLPIRWYLESTGSVASMQCICASVSSEGGHDPLGITYSAARTTAKTTLGLGTRTPLISLRPKLTFNALVNNVHLIWNNISFLATTADNLFIEIIMGGTLTGASWTSVDVDSHSEFDQAATAITGGRAIYQDYVSSTTRGPLSVAGQINLKTLPLTLNADGTQDNVTICVTRIGNNNADCFAGFNWREVH